MNKEERKLYQREYYKKNIKRLRAYYREYFKQPKRREYILKKNREYKKKI